jgi:hypothetical protein
MRETALKEVNKNKVDTYTQRLLLPITLRILEKWLGLLTTRSLELGTIILLLRRGRRWWAGYCMVRNSQSKSESLKDYVERRTRRRCITTDTNQISNISKLTYKRTS